MPSRLVLIVSALLIVFSGCRRERPPFRAEEALATFRLAQGFRIELAAAEPEVEDPVAIGFDARGRMYVAEMPDYPMGRRPGRIKLLEDRDGDGRYERGTLFASDLQFPNGVMAWKGGILVTAAPDILFLADSDGDGRADVRRVVLTGFAALNPQLRANGLIYGLDNWIYGAYPKFGPPNRYVKEFGDRGTPLRFPDRPGVEPVDVFRRGMDFRFRPDEFKLEAVAGNSQFGNTFDAWGNRFTVWNNNHVRHVVLQNAYAARNPYLAVESMESAADHGNAATVFPVTERPMHMHESEIGHFTSACGIARYEGGIFPKPFDRALFVCEPVHNLVHADLVEERGATFRARRAVEGAEFLASTDSWFRPVHTTVGPDGALYVVDFYRKIVEHPEWIPPDMMNDADLDAGHDRGRIYRVVHEAAPRFPTAPLDAMTSAELVSELAHPNLWRRATAQRLLVERREGAALPLLEGLAREGATPQARAHALWTLDGTGALSGPLLLAALGDGDARVREQAVRAAETRLTDPAVAAKLAAMAAHASGRLEFQLACTLGFLPPDVAYPALEAIAARHLEDPWFQTAVLTAASDNPLRWFRAFAPRGAEALLRRIASIVGARAKPEEVAEVVAASGGAGVLEGLSAGIRRAPAAARRLDARGEVLVLALVEPPSSSRAAALDLATAVTFERTPRLESLLRRAASTAASESTPVEERAHAARLLGLDPSASTRDALLALLVPREPEAVQVAAAQALAALRDPKILEALVGRWKSSTGRVREVVLGAFFARRERLGDLAAALEAGVIEPSSLSRARKTQLSRALREQGRSIAPALAAVLSEESRKKVIESYRPALRLEASAERGAAVYQRACSRCHRAAEAGFEVGPDLAGLASRTREDLLVQILDPNAYIVPGYEEYAVDTTDGRVTSGVVARETATSVALRRSGGEEETILRAQVARIRSLSVSQMPEDLEKGISLREMADLLAFIKGLAAKRPSESARRWNR